MYDNKKHDFLMTTVQKHSHINTLNRRFFLFRKGLCVLLLALGWLFSFHTAIANDATSGQIITNEESTVVVADSHSVIITSGKITTTEGKTIRLLPGTHIKSGDQLTVNIASKEEQAAIAREQARQKEEKMLAVAAEKRKEAQLPTTLKEVTSFFHYQQLPEEAPVLSQQTTLLLVGTMTNTTVSFAAPVILLVKKNTNDNFPFLATPLSGRTYKPVLSWGEQAETIGIMRC